MFKFVLAFAFLGVALCESPPKDLTEKIRRIFNNIDASFDGIVTEQEVFLYFSEYSKEPGKVTLGDFHHLWNHRYHDTDATMTYLFNQLDKATGDGVLTLVDLTAIFQTTDINPMDGNVLYSEFWAMLHPIYLASPNPMPHTMG